MTIYAGQPGAYNPYPAPTSQDPFSQAAYQQGSAANANVNQQTVANRANQVNAQGSQLTWSVDPNTGQWTQNISYGGPQSTLYGGEAGAANSAVSSLSNPIDTSNFTSLYSLNGASPGQFNQQAQQAVWNQFQPLLAQSRSAQEAQLANQGITRGSEAFQQAQDQLGRNESNAQLQSIMAGFGQGNTEFNQALNLANATAQQRAGQLGETSQLRYQPLQDYMSLAGAAGNPSFGSYGQAGVAAPPNYLGAAQSAYNAALDKQNLSADQQASLLNGLFGLGGTFLQTPTGQNAIGDIGSWLGNLFGLGGP